MRRGWLGAWKIITVFRMRRCCARALAVLVLSFGWMISAGFASGQERPKSKKPKEVASRADFRKHFATLEGIGDQGRAVFRKDGDTKAGTRPLLADAEDQVAGWWGSVEPLIPGDPARSWSVMDPGKSPVGLLTPADEISEQAIHIEPAMV